MAELSAALTLVEPWPSRVLGGIPGIPVEELAQLPQDLAPGAVLPLVNTEKQMLAYGLFDPENEMVRVLPADNDEVFDAGFFIRRVERAAQWRRRLGLVTPQGAYRLINAEGDGLPGFVVDVLGDCYVLYTYSTALQPFLEWIARGIQACLPFTSIVGKVRPTGDTPTGRIEHQLLAGTEPPRQLVVVEDNIRYEVHPLGGLNVGLFPDMRDVRRAFAHWIPGQRVLNTFAYTGSFSLVAALRGAAQVTTIELASGVVQWSKTNFQLNELDPEDRRFRFVKGDVFDYLKTARRQDEQFDVVVLDPPAATSLPGRRWFLKTDYDRLMGHALKVMPRGGLLVVAASSVQSRPDQLDHQIRLAARNTSRRLRLVQSFGLPPDYPTQMIYPQSRYLKVSFLLVD